MKKSARGTEEDIFDAARRIVDAGAREAYLKGACDGDDALRMRVVKLLAAHERADAFFLDCTSAFEGPFDVSAGLASLEEDEWISSAGRPGRLIGPYKLIRRIGEGAYGVVYLAEQERPLRRRVAIKIIKLGMDTRAVIARFEAERQALARMEHPGIAKVLDAGATETGRPYFVMEYVEGVRVTEYCDENQLGIRKRLELFIQICHAIQHAHQKGIIHRDIKPSNVLVTVEGGVAQPKVIDFGIAKATTERLTDETLRTTNAELIGTPSYMSPEQAEWGVMDIDTRSDIYSLGVLLYEILTGRTPFDPKELTFCGSDRMRRIIIEREPLRPSLALKALAAEEISAVAGTRDVEIPRLLTALGGDLDWIVMRAMEKMRARRYDTAYAMAEDIERYLRFEPVVARPPSHLYRLRKIVRRNRAAFLSAAVVTTALFAALGTSLEMVKRERDARDRAEVAEERANIARMEESELRQAAEARARMTQAIVMVNRYEFAEAEALVDDEMVALAISEGSVGTTEVFRSLAGWNIVIKQWERGLERFEQLFQVNEFDRDITVSLDNVAYAALLMNRGKDTEYERFRNLLIKRYSGADDVTVAERTMKAVLLQPINETQTRRLLSMAELLLMGTDEKGFEADSRNWLEAWRAYSLTLWYYRVGNWQEAKRWGVIGSQYEVTNPSFQSGIDAILAMAHIQEGEIEVARPLIASSKKRMAHFSTLEELPQSWYDSFIAIMLREEAEEMIGESWTAR